MPHHFFPPCRIGQVGERTNSSLDARVIFYIFISYCLKKLPSISSAGINYCMPTRREAVKGLLSLSVSPLMPMYAIEMQQKLMPLIPLENQKRLENSDFKEFIFLAMDYVEEFINMHKDELIQISLILLALCILLAAGLVPTKALIMHMIL